MNDLILITTPSNSDLTHHGILGMKWGVRRYQNADGTLTTAGRRRYQKNESMETNNKNDSSITKRVKNDYNNLSDSDFKKKYQVSKETYRKRVNKYGDPYKNSSLSKIGKKIGEKQKNSEIKKYVKKNKKTLTNEFQENVKKVIDSESINKKFKEALAYGQKHHLDLDDGGGGSRSAGEKYVKMMKDAEIFKTKKTNEAYQKALDEMVKKHGKKVVKEFDRQTK